MKRAGMALALVLAFVGVASAQQYQNYLPLKQGNAWTYQNQKWGNEVVQKVASEYYGMYYVEGFLGEGKWLAYVGNTLYAWNDAAQQWGVLFRFGAPTGTTYPIDQGGLFSNVSVRVDSRTAVFQDTVMQQNFYNCIRFTFKYATPIFDAGIGSMTFAPGVGLVETTSQSIAGPVQVVLKSAVVGTKRIGLINYTSLEQGAYSQYPATAKKVVVINSQTAWDAFYAQHNPGQTPPAVNFAKQTVVAVLAGERPTSGYNISVNLVRWNFPYSGAKVFVTEVTPTTIPVLQVITHPFDVVVLDEKAYSASLSWKVVAGP